MDLGETILIGLGIVGFVVIIVCLIAKSPMEDDTPENPFSEPNKSPMWTTITRYGPTCCDIKVVNNSYVKYCTLEPSHPGDHNYKHIMLDEETNNEDLS